MPRITKLYTRTGDDGTTALGGGQRLPKDSLRIAAYGTVDELNSCLGLALAGGLAEPLPEALAEVQNTLFHLGSDLCFLEEDKRRPEEPEGGGEGWSVPRVEERHVEALEGLIDRLAEEVGPLENFILPGGAPGAAALQLARTVCRRAEREAVALAREEPIGRWVGVYLNRLSDALFVMARFENLRRGVEEPLWNSRR